MSITSYVSNFQGLLLELQESLCEDEICDLKDDVSALSMKDWVYFVRSNQKLIESFQSAQPSRREKVKKYQIPELKKRLVLAAAQRVKSAILLAETEIERQLVGLSYREASVAGAAHYDGMTRNLPLFYWPFDLNPPEGFWVDTQDVYPYWG